MHELKVSSMFFFLLDFLAYLKDQVPGWYLNVVLGFIEAYFLLALVAQQVQTNLLLWLSWQSFSDDIEANGARQQTFNKGEMLSIANVWMGVPLSVLLQKWWIYLSSLDPCSERPRDFGTWPHLGHTSFLNKLNVPSGIECWYHFRPLFSHWSFLKCLSCHKQGHLNSLQAPQRQGLSQEQSPPKGWSN